MANLSDLTRKEQVLARLKAADGGWVDGPDLANEEVGGSEGLRRLRELVDDGHNVRKRRHPDPDRDIWQYRLAPPALVLSVDDDITEAVADDVAEASYAEAFPESPPPPRSSSPWPADHQQVPIRTAIRRKEDGTYEYVPPQQPLHAPEQLTTPPDPPQPEGRAFDELPSKIRWGEIAVCPRCHGKTTRGKPRKPVDETALTPKQRRERERRAKEPGLIDADGVLLYKDPSAKPTQPCRRCNGYGIVPNVGPIPLTLPNTE